MIAHLKSILKQTDTVLFIGSGVSLWSGLPTWTGLLKNLSAYLADRGLDHSIVDKEIKNGDLLLAASYGFDLLTLPMIANFMREQCQMGIAKPHEIHHKIVGLGPTCYVTTNYDKLMELALSRWQPDSYFRAVVNHQLTEMAEIVGARSEHFVFKLHGDVEYANSIILTKEHYRALNPGGELSSALDTIRTLQVSRSFLYIGFGLKDPDFLLMKDMIANTYKGGERDHYAIMPDVSEQEKDFWRRKFGIHLISYKTIKKTDGSSDHSALISLLDQLQPDSESLTPVVDSNTILFLARHGARHAKVGIADRSFPLVVNYKRESIGVPIRLMGFIDAPVDKLLDSDLPAVILIGAPGGGKSFSIQQSLSKLSEKLWASCMTPDFQIADVVVPIFLDLKQYNGNLYGLLEETLPPEIRLDVLLANFKVKIYLDSFNEMPRNYLDDNTWTQDFISFREHATRASYVISSRTADGLKDLGFPVFELNLIDASFVRNFIAANLGGFPIVNSTVVEVLRKPFFYKLALGNAIQLGNDTTPAGIYRDVFNDLSIDFQKRFNVTVVMSDILKDIAFEALDNGRETFTASSLEAKFDAVLLDLQTEITGEICINWLISRGIVMPLPRKLVSFFHQSVTEYLAARKLSELYLKDQTILGRKLTYRVWDQAVFLAISIFSEDEVAGKFLDEILAIDLKMAFSAVFYMEFGTEQVVDRLLQELVKGRFDFEGKFYYGSKIKNELPLTSRNIPQLEALVELGDEIGACAALRLYDLRDDFMKKDLLLLMARFADDYTFCQRIGRSFKENGWFMTEDWPDLQEAIVIAYLKFDKDDEESLNGFDSGVGDVIEAEDVENVFSQLYDRQKPLDEQLLSLRILCEHLHHGRDNISLKIGLQLLEDGLDEVSYTIYSMSRFSHQVLDYSIVKPVHIQRLLNILNTKRDSSEWALNAMEILLKERIDLKVLLDDGRSRETGMERIISAYLTRSLSDFSEVFEGFQELLRMADSALTKQKFGLISHMNINWAGQEALFVSLLRLRNKSLAYQLADSVTGGTSRSRIDAKKLDFGPIEWWLAWFEEAAHDRTELLFEDRLIMLMNGAFDDEYFHELVRMFNAGETRYRSTLARTFLTRRESLSIKDFTEEALNFLIDDLHHIFINIVTRSLIGEIATEDFVTERLLPLYADAVGILKHNLTELLTRLGEKFRRRYISS